jgi:bifunctional DNA-binding transcriptional regulator/antitoxin component of YhaV-PrlF toxin-antitoxin module
MNENENKTITTTLRIQGDGRIQIPSNIRKELKLNPLDLVELKIRKI